MDSPVSTHNLLVEASAELLRSGQSIRFKAAGRSMLPTIRDGEMITVVPVAPWDIRRGDILLHRSRKGLIAHRCVSLDRRWGGEPRYVVRGDAAEECDAPVAPQQLLGKVISVERAGRRVPLCGWSARMRRAAQQILSVGRREAWAVPKIGARSKEPEAGRA